MKQNSYTDIISEDCTDNQEDKQSVNLKNEFIKNLYESGYFSAPDNIFGSELSAYAKLLVFNLCRRADKVGVSFPSRNRIAKDCGICPRTVDKVIKELISFGLVTINPRVGKSNIYKLDDSILELLKRQSTHAADAGGYAGDAPLPPQEMHPKEYTLEGKSNKENRIPFAESKSDSAELEGFEEFFKAFRETTRLLGRDNYGDSAKSIKEYKKLPQKERNKLLPYLAECRRKKLVADAIREVKIDRKDPDIRVPQLSWFSDCQRFLKNKEWAKKNLFEVEPPLTTDSEIQKKHWENEGYKDGRAKRRKRD